jgi:hypothetical protein
LEVAGVAAKVIEQGIDGKEDSHFKGALFVGALEIMNP